MTHKENSDNGEDNHSLSLPGSVSRGLSGVVCFSQTSLLLLEIHQTMKLSQLFIRISSATRSRGEQDLTDVSAFLAASSIRSMRRR